MAYRLKQDVPEPLSREALRRLRSQSDDKTEKVDLPHMTSDSYKRIRFELLRYCRGDLEGLSVLIAGQRGAGKTTLAKLVIQSVMQHSKHLIPLPLILHGPTIIETPADEPGAGKPADAKAVSPVSIVQMLTPSGHAAPVPPQPVQVLDGRADPSSAARKVEEEEKEELERKLKLKKQALTQLIQALYRHLSDAMQQAWQVATDESPDSRRPRHEMLELCAHVDLRLELAPDPETLRGIWSRAGFLQTGVACYLRPVARDGVGRPKGRDTEPPSIAGHPDDQGLREIVALAACADAYRVILGKTTEKLSNTRKDEETAQRGIQPAPSGAPAAKDAESKAKTGVEKLAPAVLGTAAGGLSVLGHDALTTVLGLGIGALVWFISWLVIGYDVKRKSTKDIRSERVTEVDWTVTRLERDFPALLRRVKDAGFAPIFVLDELDKVPDATRKLEDFLSLCKHIVTDHAAFLFLTNRDYYERLLASEQLDGRGDGK